MNSFNHYSLGSVGEWFYSGAAGIELDESHPGFKHFALKPQFTARLSFVKASLDSPYGPIISYWRTSGDQMLYDVTVPPNTTADLTLPVFANRPLEPGAHHFAFPLASMNAK